MSQCRLNGLGAREFLLGGLWTKQKATFTLKSVATGKHFTYRVTAAKTEHVYNNLLFVSVLVGPDNASHYKYLGIIIRKQGICVFRTTKNAKFSKDSQCLKAFAWAFPHIAEGNLPESLEFWHEGKCCRCGRKLTTPESISIGIGPICANN